ncbi:MAG: glucose-6-phosphate isomerase, partial [Actinophytocola sp.]|nr:glucose-6-phosphate isomerase [Actinophytocola sp.]
MALTSLPTWQKLRAHRESLADVHLRDLFAQDARRGESLTAEHDGVYLDYSKNRVTAETLDLLTQLARERGLAEGVESMFAGERVNVTENRSVLHTALRAAADATVIVNGEN